MVTELPLCNLDGAEESTADTIRYWLATNNPPNGVTIISGGGCDTDQSPLTDNDMRYKKKEQHVYVQLRDGETETLDQSQNITFGARITYIDIFGRHAYSANNQKQMEIVRDWVDDLLQRSSRKQSWVKASDPDHMQKSSITGLRNYSCNWERIEGDRGDQDTGIIDQLTGEIETYWQRNR